MKLADAIKWIEDPAHKLVDFAVRFKKVDGSIRLMNCQTGYQDDLILSHDPFKKKIDFKSRGVVSVYDMDKKEYRCFKPGTLISIKINGVWNQIEEAAHNMGYTQSQ